jgi:hypothetical protein
VPADPAPIIVAALFGAEDFAWLDGLRRAHFPPERNILSAHLTLFHHLPPSLAAELRRRLSDVTAGPAPAAETHKLLDLGGGTAIGIASPGLQAIRCELAEAFTGLLTPQDAAGWRPHVTIQNKVPRDAAKQLQQTLAAEFRPRPIRLAGLAAYHYRGGPWELISRHRFAAR